MSDKYVTMFNPVTGIKITGVHVDAVPAHEAIGFQVVAEAEKPVKAEAKAADNDTARKKSK